MEMIKYITYINAILAVYSFIMLLMAIKNASTIEYNVRKDNKMYQWLHGKFVFQDDKFLFRKALRLKLYFLLGVSISHLLEIGGRVYPTLLPYQSDYFAYVALFRYVGIFMLSLLFWLLYRNADFTFLKITEKKE